ncbi:hypothetical protein Btru_050823 [Bulinus truncatus]|nr:hypothetical protein Btru_050823 [Bulinus truncatus]
MTLVDCFQNSNPPCGKDFPQTITRTPTAIRPSSDYDVHLHMPTRHYNSDKQGSYVISIRKSGTEEFTLLGKWPDGQDEFKTFTVRIPTEPGQYLLQAIYQPAGRTYFSCADVEVTADAPAPVSPAGSNRPAPLSSSESVAIGPHLRLELIFVMLLLCIAVVCPNIASLLGFRF